MSTALATIQAEELDTMQRTAKMMMASGFFGGKGEEGIAQIAVKIMAGREMGYGPFASVRGIHVIQGSPTLSANLMAAAVKASGKYTYRVRKMEDDGCAIEFFEMYQGGRESIGISTFTIADAKRANTKNMGAFPRNMLFARAMSNGVRWYCPDVFSGNAVYTPEELGAPTDDDGYIIVDGASGEVIEQPKAGPAKSTEPQPTITSLADVDELSFDETTAAQREWEKLDGVPAGVGATEHEAAKAAQAAPQPRQQAKAQEAESTTDGDVEAVQRPDWNNPNEAKEWAVESKACKNEFEAAASLKKIVGEQFGGKLSNKNMDEVMDAFYVRQMQKLEAETVPA